MTSKSKKYPALPPGKKLIFRMTRKNPKTGRLERRPNGKPWPIVVDIDE